MPGRIDGHREVGVRAAEIEARDLLALADIDDGDLARIGHVHEEAPAFFVELEALGMTFERNVGDLPAARGIDHRQPAAAIADDDPVAPAVDADVVRIVAQRDRAGRREPRPRESRTEPSPALAT